MCGFAGFIDFNKKSNKDILREMTDTLYYRGPDDAGYCYEETNTFSLGFGHRRLSIIDLSPLGHQPMMFGSLTIVFNGEIYNYVDIRNELISKYKRSFTSHSDTEVILQAYDQWGMDCLQKFNGMFAFALHDKRNEKVILVRDRAGVKPLYCYVHNNVVLFSSELKSFHKHPQFIKELDESALALYLQYGYIPAPHSIFKRTKKVLPGSYVEIDLTTKNTKETIYWNVVDCYNQTKLDISDTEAMNETEKILKSACELRMVSDVPVGVFLSGGYDSSIVAALIQSNRTEKIKTFTIGFHESKFNEAVYAKQVANHLGTDHTEYYCSEKEAKEILPSLPYIFDEPFGDSSAIPTILVSKIARKQVTVALSADAGDETFAGYTRYETIIKQLNRLKAIPQSVTKPMAGLLNIGHSDYLIKRILGNNALNKYDAFTDILRDGVNGPTINKHIVKRVSDRRVKRLLKGNRKLINTFFDDGSLLNETNDDLSKVLAVDYKTYMTDDILVKVDRAAMSVSLEGREPLLDYRIIEFVSKLPLHMKLRGNVKKFLLKEITHKYLPKEIMERPKMGFAIPVAHWLREELSFYMKEYFDAQRIEKQGLFEKEFVNQLVSDFLVGRNEDFELIWFMLMFQLWYDEWM
jgi:asparagine synthase (glutamine-hydrolysing)